MSRSNRYFSLSFKRQVVLELLTGETTLAALARRYEVSSHLLIQWRLAYQTGRLDDQPPPQDLHALEARNRELERLVGRQALEIEFLKKAASFQPRHSSGSALIATGVASPRKRSAR
jgi:transposase-like protein